MSQLKPKVTDADTVDSHEKNLYRVGAVAALIAVLVMLSEILITFLPGGGARGEATETVLDWFTLFTTIP